MTSASSSKLLWTVLEHAMIDLSIAAALTGFMAAPSWSAERYGIVFAVNLAFAVAIATTTTLLFEHVVSRVIAPESRWRWLAFPLALAVGVVAGTEVGVMALRAAFGEDMRVARVGVYRVGLIIGAGTLAMTLLYDRLRDRTRLVELRAERAQQELLRARVANLQARLNPHFLFNSLNTVAALVEENPAKAVEAIERLSELLRYGLDGTKSDFVSLATEIGAIEDYLRIEQLRFGERLRWRIDAADEARGLSVPSLLLQPLVENAVKHGIAPRREGGVVTVTARVSAGALVLTVDDDGAGVSHVAGTQLGETSVRERLQLMYGARASFEAGPRDGGGYRVRLCLPAENADHGAPCVS